MTPTYDLVLEGLRDASQRKALETYDPDPTEALPTLARAWYPSDSPAVAVRRMVEWAVGRMEAPDLEVLARASLRLPPFQQTTIRDRIKLAGKIIAQAHSNYENGGRGESVLQWDALNRQRSEEALPRLAMTLISLYGQRRTEKLGQPPNTSRLAELIDRYRPKAPVSGVVKRITRVDIDDGGRTWRTSYETTQVALEATGGTETIVFGTHWKQYPSIVESVQGCSVLYEEDVQPGQRRVVFSVPMSQPGEEDTTIYRVRRLFDDDAPRPSQGHLSQDFESDNFELVMSVQFASRRPAIAWRYENEPRHLVPGEPNANNIIVPRVDGLMAWTFSPPTYSRKSYGLAWRY